MASFFIPFGEFYLPPGADTLTIVYWTLLSPLTNGWIGLAFVLAMIGFAILAMDNPNRSALLSDLNQPEHRGTIAGFNILLVGIGLSIGNSMTGVVQTYSANFVEPPLNYAVGLALFQLFFIPGGICYYLLTRTTPKDLANAHAILERRGKQTVEERIADELKPDKVVLVNQTLLTFTPTSHKIAADRCRNYLFCKPTEMNVAIWSPKAEPF